MANQVMNIAKGRFVHYSTLPAANDALILVLLQDTGLDADDVLNNFDDLGALLAANTEADFTNYARKTITSVTVTVDDTGNLVDVDFADQTFTAAGGGTDNLILKAIVCYDPDTTGGADSAIIPLSHHDLNVQTDGNNFTIELAAAGFARAAQA
jgi:hypothetical protein